MISIKKSKYYNLKNIALLLCLAILSLNSNQPSLAENAQQNQNLTLDIDLLSVSESGEVSFLVAVTEATVGGKFRIFATSAANPELARELTVTIIIRVE